MPKEYVARISTFALFALFPIALFGCTHDSAVTTASVCGNVFEVVHGRRKNVDRAYVFVSDRTGQGERHPLDPRGRYSATGLSAGPITVLAQVAGGSTVTCSVAAGIAAQIDMNVSRHDAKIRKLACPAPLKTAPDCFGVQNG